MTAQEFAEKLTERNRALRDPVVDPFLSHAGFQAILCDKIHSQGDLQSCLQEARHLQELSSASEEPGFEEELPKLDPFQPEKVYDELEEPVKDLRKDIFGSDEPPFPQWDDAVSWIQLELSQVKETPKNPELDKALQIRIRELKQDLEAFYDRKVDLLWPMLRLDYPARFDDGFAVRRFGVPKSHRAFRRLAEFQFATSQRTGLQPTVILIFVLSGLRTPLAFNFQISQQIIGTKIPETILKLGSAQPSWRELQAVYKYLLRQRGNRKGLRTSTKILIAEIERAGGVPRKGKMKFWERIAESVTEQTGKKLSKGAARLCFRRLSDALKQSLSA